MNVDPRESDLQRAERGWLLANFGSELFDLVAAQDELLAAGGRAAESSLWRAFLWLVIVVLAAESVMALIFGKRDRREVAA